MGLPYSLANLSEHSLLYYTLDMQAEATIETIAVDRNRLNELTRTSCRIVAYDDLTFLARGDRLSVIFGCRAATSRNYSRNYEGGCTGVLDDKGMGNLTICLFDYPEVVLGFGCRYYSALGRLGEG